MSKNTCNECGATYGPNDETCQLCGTPKVNHEDTGGELNKVVEEEAAAEGDFVEMRLCTSCTMLNPQESKFCSDCGESLATAPPARRRKDETKPTAKKASPAGQRKSSPSSPSSQKKAKKITSNNDNRPAAPKSANQQTIVLIGGALLVVIAFFMMSQPNEESASTAQTTQGQVQQGPQSAAELKQPLPEQINQQVSVLEAKLLSASGDEAIDIRRELSRLYAQGGRFDLAANALGPVTAAANHLHDWIYLGNYSFDWMQRLLNVKDEVQASEYAKKAIAAYQKALEIEPEDLNVRTDMAIAYLHDPDNPMQAILQTNKVLEMDPDHVQANFNKGIMLNQIGRFDKAREQFEKVKSLTDHETPVHQRAEQMLQRLAGSL